MVVTYQFNYGDLLDTIRFFEETLDLEVSYRFLKEKSANEIGKLVHARIDVPDTNALLAAVAEAGEKDYWARMRGEIVPQPTREELLASLQASARLGQEMRADDRARKVEARKLLPFGGIGALELLTETDFYLSYFNVEDGRVMGGSLYEIDSVAPDGLNLYHLRETPPAGEHNPRSEIVESATHDEKPLSTHQPLGDNYVFRLERVDAESLELTGMLRRYIPEEDRLCQGKEVTLKLSAIPNEKKLTKIEIPKTDNLAVHVGVYAD